MASASLLESFHTFHISDQPVLHESVQTSFEACYKKIDTDFEEILGSVADGIASRVYREIFSLIQDTRGELPTIKRVIFSFSGGTDIEAACKTISSLPSPFTTWERFRRFHKTEQDRARYKAVCERIYKNIIPKLQERFDAFMSKPGNSSVTISVDSPSPWLFCGSFFRILAFVDEKAATLSGDEQKEHLLGSMTVAQAQHLRQIHLAERLRKRDQQESDFEKNYEQVAVLIANKMVKDFLSRVAQISKGVWYPKEKEPFEQEYKFLEWNGKKISETLVFLQYLDDAEKYPPFSEWKKDTHYYSYEEMKHDWDKPYARIFTHGLRVYKKTMDCIEKIFEELMKKPENERLAFDARRSTFYVVELKFRYWIKPEVQIEVKPEKQEPRQGNILSSCFPFFQSRQ